MRKKIEKRNFSESQMWDMTLNELGPELVAEYFYLDSLEKRSYKVGTNSSPSDFEEENGEYGYPSWFDKGYKRAIDRFRCFYCHDPCDPAQSFCGDYCRQHYNGKRADRLPI